MGRYFIISLTWHAFPKDIVLPQFMIVPEFISR